MRVHRCVGQVTYLTCDLVLGEEGTAGELTTLLTRTNPDTLVLDLSVDDLDTLDDGEVEDPFRRGLLEALEEVAEEPPLLPYQRAVDWAETNGADLHPIGPHPRHGWVQSRRIRKAMEPERSFEDPEALAKAAVRGMLDDTRIGELGTRQRSNLAKSLERLLTKEPPRTVVVFTYPWGEMVSSDVRRAMGLRQTDPELLDGGWPL